MKRKDLEALGIEGDVLDSVMNMYGKSVETHKTELETLKGDNATLQEQLTQSQSNIDKLKETADLSETTKAELEKIQQQYENDKTEWENKLKDNRKNAQVEVAIAGSGTIDDVSVKAHLSSFLSKAEMDEQGVIVGLDEELSKLKEEKAYLFGNAQPNGAKHKTPVDKQTELQDEVYKAMGL